MMQSNANANENVCVLTLNRKGKYHFLNDKKALPKLKKMRHTNTLLALPLEGEYRPGHLNLSTGYVNFSVGWTKGLYSLGRTVM